MCIRDSYISDITDTQTVDQNSSYGYSAVDLGLFLADFQYISGGQDEDIVLTDAPVSYTHLVKRMKNSNATAEQHNIRLQSRAKRADMI